MARTVLAWLVGGVLAVLAALYVASTVLLLLPPNPLTLQLWPITQLVPRQFFGQNWRLFAPNPIRSNFVMAVRCRVGAVITPWRDPFTPWLARHHQNRLSPMGKSVRIPQNAMLFFLGRRSDEWRPLLCRQAPDHPVCRRDDPASRTQRALGQFILVRLATQVCDEVMGAGRASQVQISILMHTPPPWSGRSLPAEAGSTRYVTLPWLGREPQTQTRPEGPGRP